MQEVYVKNPIQLAKCGSLAVMLPLKAARKMGISKETPVQLTLQDNKIVISKYSGEIEGI